MFAKEFSTHEVFNQSPVFEDINLYSSNRVLVDVAQRELGEEIQQKLSGFGEIAGSARAVELARQANENPPKFKPFDQKGNRIDQVEFHPAYHDLMSISMKQRLHCSPHEDSNSVDVLSGSNLARCVGNYISGQMEAGHGCPISMTNASVAPLKKQMDVSAPWIDKLMSDEYDPSFKPMEDKKSVTIGMGMTEKQGGTDVRANTTQAEAAGAGGAGQEYLITGHKWFMSAPMCDAFLVLAQAPAGLSCFLLPRILPDGQINNIRFQRLKEKMGNKSNASSEVEFHKASGWLIGEEGRGIATIIDMVSYTRVDCLVGSAALINQAFSHAVFHTKYRSVFQKKLIDQPLMAQVLADLSLDMEATTRLAFRVAKTFDNLNDETEAALERVLVPVAKYWVCKTAPAFAYEALECMGGNGYVEDGVMSRIYREAPLNAIWEGSGNVMCLDLLRVLQRNPDSLELVLNMLSKNPSGSPYIAQSLMKLKDYLSRPGEMERNARTFVELLAVTMAAYTLYEQSSQEVADAFASSRLGGNWRYTYGTGLDGFNAQSILASSVEFA